MVLRKVFIMRAIHLNHVTPKDDVLRGDIQWKKPRSYAVFADEHEEDLLYLETDKVGHTIFATKSGIYRFHNETDTIDGSMFRRLVSYFEKLGPTESNRTDEIKYVVVDERVPYEYKIDGLDGCVCGEILVPPNATDQYIRKLIMDDLKILYRKA